MPINEERFRQLIVNKADFGKEPAEEVLAEADRKIVAISMAVNAALVQFVNEGLLPIEQQIHFMVHVQDFMQRLMDDEGINLPNTVQTFAVNSLAGNMYRAAAETAFKQGSENLAKLKELSQQASLSQDNNGEFDPETNNLGDANVSSKPTLH